MTTMISEVYDALKDAEGVSDEKARKAAEAVAQFDIRFTELKTGLDAARSEWKVDFAALRADFAALKTDFAALKTDFAALKTEFEALKGRVNLIQWQLTVLIGGVVVLVLKAFLP